MLSEVMLILGNRTLVQIVMEGFLRISLPPWQRRMVTRLVAMVPAAVVAGVAGNRGAGKLLVLSQASIPQISCPPCGAVASHTEAAPAEVLAA
jgi:Mn2+/Fe2+ NRAMP family transporter